MIKKIVHEFEVNMQLLMNTYSRSVDTVQGYVWREKMKTNKNDNIFIVKKPIYDQFKKKKKVIRLNRQILSENNQWIVRDKTHQ